MITFRYSDTDSLNVMLRKNRFTAHKLNKIVYHNVWALTANQKPAKPIEFPRFQFIRYAEKQRFYDWENLNAGLKPIVDGLRHAGIIVNDSYQRTGPWMVSQIAVSKGQGAWWQCTIWDSETESLQPTPTV